MSLQISVALVSKNQGYHYPKKEKCRRNILKQHVRHHIIFFQLGSKSLDTHKVPRMIFRSFGRIKKFPICQNKEVAAKEGGGSTEAKL